MYISRRSTTVRNALVSVVNGGVTLVILLIAPMGLAAVIINTLLVTFATYIVSSAADRVVKWLEPGGKAELISPPPGNSSSRKSKLQRWWQ
ncbi:MAG: CRISPR-associated protein Csx18 [Nostoc sp.]